MIASRLAVAVLMGAIAATQPLRADGVEISLGDGRVTLVATDAPLTDVLAAWSRVGRTRFVGVDRLDNRPVTLYLVDAVEADALRLLLRSVPGYVAAPRPATVPGASAYDRVLLLTARRPPGLAAPSAGVPGALADSTGVAPGPAPLPPADLQRLLDAVSGRQPATGLPETDSGPPAVGAGFPAIAAPLPGMIVAPRESSPPR